MVFESSIPSHSKSSNEVKVMAYKKSKSGGLTGNLVKIGGSKRKLKLAGDMRGENMVGGFKKGAKQAHKRA